MKPKNTSIYLFVFLMVLLYISCSNNNETASTALLQKHLNALVTRNIDELKSTLSPSGKIDFILSNMTPTKTTDEFIDFHEKMFTDSSWTINAEIITSNIGTKIAHFIVEINYSSITKNNKPFNSLLHTSYLLQKEKNDWYVVLDHATTIK